MSGREAGMPEIIDVDFPVLFPLCEARVVYSLAGEELVSFCANERTRRSRLCSFHLDMRRSRNGTWRDCEVLVS